MAVNDNNEPEPEPQPPPIRPIVGTFVSSDEVELPDGRVLDLSGRRPPPDRGGSVPVTVLDVIRPFHFSVCPICLTGAPTSREHVPPAAIGGHRVTATCEDCNQRFGPLEAELDLHSRNALPRPVFTGEPVQGHRRARELATSFQADGSPVWMLDQADPAVRQMLERGHLQMTFRLPKRSLWRTALLKHAYLGAAVYLRTIPQSTHADVVRAELLQARLAGADHSMGAVADGIRILRLYNTPPAPLYLAAADFNDVPHAMIGLGRCWLVAWPMPDVADALCTRLTEARNGLRSSR